MRCLVHALPIGNVLVLAIGPWMMFHDPRPKGICSSRPADLIVVLDGTPARLKQAERFLQHVLQEHPRPRRSLEPAHLLIRCPRASSPPPRSRPWQIGSSAARLLLPSASGSPPIPITPPVPPCSPASPWPVVASRSSQTHRLLPAPASTASSSATPCASPLCAPLGLPALGWRMRLLPVNEQIVGFRGCRPAAS